MNSHELIAHTLAAQDQTLALASSIPDAAYADQSALPGWQVAHVVAHLVGNAEAQSRQVEYALRNELIEVYTGGQEFRDAEIERRRALPPAQLRADLEAEHDRFAKACAQLDEAALARPVEFRSGTVTDVVRGRWMESLVHSVDLGQPHFTSDDWDPVFAEVLIGYLLERLPADRRIRLQATDAALDVTVGEGGAELVISAPIAAIAGFLSDRGPSLAPEIELGPYPRGSIKS